MDELGHVIVCLLLRISYQIQRVLSLATKVSDNLRVIKLHVSLLNVQIVISEP